MEAFKAIHATHLDSIDLPAEMDTQGYILIRGLLPPADLEPLRQPILRLLHQAGWLHPYQDPMDRIVNPNATCADGDSVYKEVYDQVFGLPPLHALPHHAILQNVMQRLVGPSLFIHPKSVVRLVFPNFDRAIIHAHQDHGAVAGDTKTFTAWMPLHDCPISQGPLRVLGRSHRFGLQPTVGQTGYILPGTERGGDWVGGDIHAGDLLLFHSLTVHEALPNRSTRMRISIDCRFQSYEHPVNPGVLVFAGSGRRSWEKTYANWPSDELKYYWTRLPLQLQPSLAELARLAQTADSSEMRGRCARILQRVEEQMSLAPR